MWSYVYEAVMEVQSDEVRTQAWLERDGRLHHCSDGGQCLRAHCIVEIRGELPLSREHDDEEDGEEHLNSGHGVTDASNRAPPTSKWCSRAYVVCVPPTSRCL